MYTQFLFLNNKRLSCSGKQNFLKRLLVAKVFSFQVSESMLSILICELWNGFFLPIFNKELSPAKCFEVFACLDWKRAVFLAYLLDPHWLADSISYLEAIEGKHFLGITTYSFHVHLRKQIF